MSGFFACLLVCGPGALGAGCLWGGSMANWMLGGGIGIFASSA